MDFFEENPINRNDNIEAYSKLTENKTKIAESKEINKVEKDNKTPKPIVVKNIQNLENFAATGERDCDPNFLVKIAK